MINLFIPRLCTLGSLLLYLRSLDPPSCFGLHAVYATVARFPFSDCQAACLIRCGDTVGCCRVARAQFTFWLCSRRALWSALATVLGIRPATPGLIGALEYDAGRRSATPPRPLGINPVGCRSFSVFCIEFVSITGD